MTEEIFRPSDSAEVAKVLVDLKQRQVVLKKLFCSHIMSVAYVRGDDRVSLS